jgi:hypothetical protein
MEREEVKKRIAERFGAKVKIAERGMKRVYVYAENEIWTDLARFLFQLLLGSSQEILGGQFRLARTFFHKHRNSEAGPWVVHFHFVIARSLDLHRGRIIKAEAAVRICVMLVQSILSQSGSRR